MLLPNSRKPKPKPKRNIRVSASALDTFLECAQKFKYDRVDRLDIAIPQKEEVSEAKGGYMDKGDFYHVLLRIYYKCRVMGIKRKDAMELASLFGRGYAPQSKLPIAVTEWLIGLFREYVPHNARFTWKVVDVEEYFAFPLYEDDEDRILLDGIIDLTVDTGDLGIMPVDHKTSSRYSMPHEMGNQFKAYSVAMGTRRICINKILISKSVPEGRFRFSRHTLSFKPFELVRWIDDTVHHIKQMAEFLETNYFPMNETNCYKYNSRCRFMPLCKASSDNHIEYVANSKFTVNEQKHLDPAAYKVRQEEEKKWILEHA